MEYGLVDRSLIKCDEEMVINLERDKLGEREA